MSREVMADEKINISWDDLQTRRVDNRLREQNAVERNRAYAQMRDDALPVASAPATPALWTNPIFVMALFGLIGGLLAWAQRRGPRAVCAESRTPDRISAWGNGCF